MCLKLACIVLGLAGILQQGNALQCYDCEMNANSQEMCGPPHGYGKLVDCNTRSYQEYLQQASGFIPSDKANVYNIPLKCAKITFKSHGRYGYVRKCMLEMESLCSIYKEIGVKESVVVGCDFCDTDGCNTAPITTCASILFVITSLLIVFYI